MSDKDEELFREAMSDVAPLPSKRRKRPPRDTADGAAGARPSLAQRRRREAAVSERARGEDPNYLTLGEVPPVQPRDFLAWKKDGVQEGVFRKLRLGKYPVDAALDLHRHTVREARAALFAFLEQSGARSRRTLLVTHGRGERSPSPARLKSYVAYWLRQHPRVIAVHSAERRRGGTGAVYVLLRKSDDAKELNRERHGGKS